MDTLGKRIRVLRGKNSQVWLAKKLGIPPTTLSNYEHDKSELNFALIEAITTIFQVNTDWLLFGRGPMRPSDAETLQDDLSHPAPHDEALRRFESRLDALEDERRELNAENRQLHRDKAELLRENGELREKVARLEERKRRHDLTHGVPAEDSDVA